MNIFDEFYRIVKQLENRHIQYVLVGGVAMAFHVEPRFTKDIDILIAPDDFEIIKGILEKEEYFESATSWTFKNTPLTLCRFLKIKDNEEMVIDILVAGTDRHKKIIQDAVEAESKDGKLRVAGKQDLIWLKHFRNSRQYQADIEKLENEEE